MTLYAIFTVSLIGISVGFLFLQIFDHLKCTKVRRGLLW